MTWFRNPFRRRATPVAQPPAPRAPLVDSPEDWAVGDWAECTHPDGWVSEGRALPGGPRLGERFVVRRVETHFGAQFLGFTRWPKNTFQAVAFVRVSPRADALETSVGDWTPVRQSWPARESEPA